MKHFCCIIFSVILFCACSSTLNIAEINNLNKTEFEKLYIQPDIELYDFRIDIIRQTYEKELTDSTSETKEEPYHVLGFNLGNSLFYDLNDNLSIRIDYLLNMDTDEDFKIKKSFSRTNRYKLYSSVDGEFISEYSNRKRKHLSFIVKRFDDSLSVGTFKNKRRYSIKKNDSTLIYMNRRSILSKIHRIDDSLYVQRFRKREIEYRCNGNEILLKDLYIIRLNADVNEIEILRIGRKKNYPLYKIIRSENNIFIYNDKYFGKKIEIDKDAFKLFYNDYLSLEYKQVE